MEEPIQDIAHLGHIELLTPKPDESLWYFIDLLGMEQVHWEGQSAYLRGYGDYATFTLKLTEAATANVPPPDPNNPLVRRVMRMRAAHAARKQGQ